MDHKERHLAEMLMAKPGQLTYMVRLTLAKLYAKKVMDAAGGKLPKFPYGALVRVIDPDNSDYNYDAVICKSGYNHYGLVILNTMLEPHDECYWFNDEQLELIDEDPELGLILISAYKQARS